MTIIKTCCALHNYVRDRDGVRLEDTLEIRGLQERDEEPSYQLHRGGNAAYVYRNRFAQYFSSAEGALSWQDSKI